MYLSIRIVFSLLKCDVLLMMVVILWCVFEVGCFTLLCFVADGCYSGGCYSTVGSLLVTTASQQPVVAGNLRGNTGGSLQSRDGERHCYSRGSVIGQFASAV